MRSIARAPLWLPAAALLALLGAGSALAGCDSGIKLRDAGPPVDAPPIDGGQPSCGAYCETMSASCGGADAQYESVESCERICARAAGWSDEDPVGPDGPRAGDTLSCRAFHAREAASDPSLCEAAGPSGGGVCGSLCESYCRLALRVCSAENSLYTSTARCVESCASLTNAGSFGDESGDSLHCRITHLLRGSDLGLDVAAECRAASMSGGGVCGELPPDAGMDAGTDAGPELDAGVPADAGADAGASGGMDAGT